MLSVCRPEDSTLYGVVQCAPVATSGSGPATLPRSAMIGSAMRRSIGASYLVTGARTKRFDRAGQRHSRFR